MVDQKHQVFVTESNAKMLSSDIASSLDGRFLTMEIRPLSFVEFIRFKGVSYTKNDLHGHKVNLIKNLFAEFYHYGGFPEILKFENKKEYLHTIYTTVLYNDTVLRNNIRNIHGLRLLIKKIAESSKDEISYNHLKNLLVEASAKAGISTVISWVDSLKNAFIIREIKSLVKAANLLSVDTLIILTYNQEEEIIIKSHKISILPLWKYIIMQTNRWN